MTVAEFEKSVTTTDMQSAKNGMKPFADAMKEITHIWSNDACRGYCIAAMKAAGMTEEQINKVLSEMYYVFDEKTISEAEDIYTDF